MTGRVEVDECFSSFKSIHVKRKLHLPLLYLENYSSFSPLTKQFKLHEEMDFQLSRQALPYPA